MYNTNQSCACILPKREIFKNKQVMTGEVLLHVRLILAELSIMELMRNLFRARPLQPYLRVSTDVVESNLMRRCKQAFSEYLIHTDQIT